MKASLCQVVGCVQSGTKGCMKKDCDVYKNGWKLCDIHGGKHDKHSSSQLKAAQTSAVTPVAATTEPADPLAPPVSLDSDSDSESVINDNDNDNDNDDICFVKDCGVKSIGPCPDCHKNVCDFHGLPHTKHIFQLNASDDDD